MVLSPVAGRYKSFNAAVENVTSSPELGTTPHFQLAGVSQSVLDEVPTQVLVASTVTAQTPDEFVKAALQVPSFACRR